MADEEVVSTPSPTPEQMERSMLGRGHPDFKKGESAVKTTPETAAAAKEAATTETKVMEANKPAGNYRTRAVRAKEETE